MVSELNRDSKMYKKYNNYINTLAGLNRSLNAVAEDDYVIMSSTKDNFEACVESMWKLMKLINEKIGLVDNIGSPSKTIKAFHEDGYIDNEQYKKCLECVDIRNRCSHEYYALYDQLKSTFHEILEIKDVFYELEFIFEKIINDNIDLINDGS